MTAKSITVPKQTLLYRTIRSLDRAYRMVHRHPIFHALVPTNKSLALIVLILIPSLALSLYLVGQTHTKYYLLTGPHVSTASLVGPQFAEVLNKTTRLERWFLVDLIREFSAVESCGSLDNICESQSRQSTARLCRGWAPLTHECAAHLFTSPQPATGSRSREE